MSIAERGAETIGVTEAEAVFVGVDVWRRPSGSRSPLLPDS